MKRKIFGLLLTAALALILTSCPNTVTDPPKSTNADLSALTVDSGTLSPAFAPETTAYTVTVPNAVTSITLKGYKAYITAAVSANNDVPQALNVGNNTITLSVTAQDGSTLKTYVVTVTRGPASTNADLSALKVNTGTLSPAFVPGTTAYTMNVPNTVTSITLTGTKTDSTAAVSANNNVPQTLNVGANTINLSVTAQDGTTVKIYTVTVTRLQFGLTMISVPGGTFQRDATASNTSTVSAFKMSQNEITRAQFAAILTTDPSYRTVSSGTNDPVQQTNWYHAIAFCNKLSLAEGLTPVYSVTVGGTPVNWSTLTYADIPTMTSNTDWNAATANWSNNGYRLPTEMEWMWAAMGATGTGTNTTGYLKAFAGSTGSNAIGDYAVFGYKDGQAGRTANLSTNPVGSKTNGANELGLYDMSGNVLEWNWDWSGSYPTGAVTDYRGAATGSDRVRRGGSWLLNASYCAVASRGGDNPFNAFYTYGFRVVRN